jgi:hypothetical protein
LRSISNNLLVEEAAIRAKHDAEEQAMGLCNKGLMTAGAMGQAPQPSNGGGTRRRPVMWSRLGGIRRSRRG